MPRVRERTPSRAQVALVACFTDELAGPRKELAAWDEEIARGVADRVARLPWYYALAVRGLFGTLEWGTVFLAARRFSRLPLPERRRRLERFKARFPGAGDAVRLLGSMTAIEFLERARREGL